MSYFQGDSIFWVEVEKIKPNPHQPRKEFDEEKLKSLAESIRQYGVLQPLVVTRREIEKPEGGIAVEYELIAGERRLRASRIATIQQVPVIIKSGEEDALLKLELAIIENVQREDLNPIDRALAFHRLASEFGFKHTEIGKKIGKSREFISNTLRLLGLPEEIKDAVANFSITEGHGRTLMMLNDRPEEQATLFKEVVYKNLTVRETETIARRIAHDKVRKKERSYDPELVELEDKLSESLGTRVQIEKRDNGGKILIDYFSNEDIKNILSIVSATAAEGGKLDRHTMLNNFIAAQQKVAGEKASVSENDAHPAETEATAYQAEERDEEAVPPVPEHSETQVPQQESLTSGDAVDEQVQSVLDTVAQPSPEESLAPDGAAINGQANISDPATRNNGEEVTREAEPESPEEDGQTEDSEKVHEDDADLYSVTNFTI